MTDEGPQFCECAQCEFAEPDAGLGYLLYSDPDYLTIEDGDALVDD